MSEYRTRTAVITGASRGLGLAIAKELARRGWQLVIDARDAIALDEAQKELASITDSRIIAVVGDILDPDHRLQIRRGVESLGGADVIINNAGMLGPSPQPSLLDYPLDVLEQVYRTNVIAQLGVIQALRSTLRSGGRIINVTSDAGVEPYEGWGGYGSSKAALEHLSTILAVENPEYRIYWVDPGDMRTAMHQAAFPDEDISDRALPEESVPGFISLLEGNLPSGRYRAHALRREEVAA